MKFLKLVQARYAMLGIHPSNQSNPRTAFNARVFFGFLLFGYLIASQFAFIFYVANGFMTYVDCACATSASILMFVDFAAIVFNTNLLFETIHNTEKLIDTSKVGVVQVIDIYDFGLYVQRT